tara:strand:- start:2404 stop:2988 length:585 start_codon:yes stop_codon:yes gene_type:complete
VSFNWQQYLSVVGVDEAGRGCLAGRVYAAAVYMPRDLASEVFQDSKKLSEKRREALAEEIKATYAYGIAYASVAEIEELNILRAALLAMKRAVEQIQENYERLLIDGNQKIPYLDAGKQTSVIKGDQLVPAISAASILAKVKRDHYVYDLAEKYPQYGFEQHKAYATKIHKAAIAKWGPSPEHRKTFAGVREFI